MAKAGDEVAVGIIIASILQLGEGLAAGLEV